MDMDIKLIKPKDAAEILMCSERTLEAWRREDKGPNYYKIEGKILYELEELYQFIKVSKVSVSYPTGFLSKIIFNCSS